MENKILITGATGFVGTYLNRALIEEGFSVYPMSRQTGDIVDKSTWSNLPPCNDVVHLASYTNVRKSWDEPIMCLSENTAGLLNCVEYCHKHNARLIFLSSYLYGNPEVIPTPETAKIIQANPYALSKHMSEEVINFYQKKFNLNTITIRPFNIYGVGMSPHYMIPETIKQAYTERKIELFNFMIERDFIHVKDVVSLIIKTIKSEVADGVYNAGSGLSYTSLAIAKSIVNILDMDIGIEEIGADKKVNILKTQADISLAQQVFDWQPAIQMEAGLAEMVLAYKNEQG